MSAPTATPRERLLAAANELFYREGVHTVGVDRVIEQAGVAKATLYATFGSKEELIAAYLRGRHERMRARVQRAVDRHDSPRARLLAPYEALAEYAAEPGYRGCAFANATAETHGAQAEQAAVDYRAWVRATFTELAAAADAPDPEGLGRQLQLLWDGASQAVRMDHDPSAITVAASIAGELVAVALAGC